MTSKCQRRNNRRHKAVERTRQSAIFIKLLDCTHHTPRSRSGIFSKLPIRSHEDRVQAATNVRAFQRALTWPSSSTLSLPHQKLSTWIKGAFYHHQDLHHYDGLPRCTARSRVSTPFRHSRPPSCSCSSSSSTSRASPLTSLPAPWSSISSRSCAARPHGTWTETFKTLSRSTLT